MRRPQDAPKEGAKKDLSDPGREDGHFLAKHSEYLAKSLRNQGSFVDTVLAAVRDWVIVADLSLRIVKTNAAMARELGTEESCLVHKQFDTLFFDIDPPESLERARAECLHPCIVRSFSALVPDLLFRRHFTIRALLDEGGRYGFLLMGGAPSEFSGSEEDAAVMLLARRVLDGLELPVLLVDLGGQVIVDCNERFCLLFDGDRREFLHGSTRMLFADEADYLRHRSEIDYSFIRTGIHVVERAFFNRGGESILCRLTVLPFFVPGAHDEYAVCLFEDRTVERRREEHIAALVGELEKATAGLVSAYRSNMRSASSPRNLGDYGASRRQLEIGRHIIAGRSTKETSTLLGLTESTVKNHLVALYKKLGVSSRVEFMRLIAERGILPF